VPGPDVDRSPRFAPTGRLHVEESIFVDWDEAIERCVDLAPLPLAALLAADFEERFVLPGGADSEMVRQSDGAVAGRIVRRREPVEGLIRAQVRPSSDQESYVVVAITVENTTLIEVVPQRREEILAHSLVAVHTMVAADNGTFVSLLDPPDPARDLVARCHNEGAFPVLIGDDDHVLLSSPIILYDHPEIAPESPGDLYDSTEIDEILALRVLTLTDAEKAEARQTDPRAAAIIDRCDTMGPEVWGRLHGAMRELRNAGGAVDSTTSTARLDSYLDSNDLPFWIDATNNRSSWWNPEAEAAVDPWTDIVTIGGVPVTKGVNVRLRPSHRSDAQDLFLDGLAATVAGVFTDAEGDQHVAVTVDDDPANEEMAWQGRYLFFHPDEVEPVDVAEHEDPEHRGR
jgi:hypothetical protein